MSPLSRRQLLLSTAALSAGACLPRSRPRPAGPPVIDRRAVTAIVDDAVASAATPGVALAVWHDGVEVLAHQAGLADLARRTAVTVDTVFRIGSVSKQLGAALVLDLARQGALALTDAAHVHLPMFAGQPRFTIGELLTHTAGIHDGEYPAGLPRTHAFIEQAELIARATPLFDFPPGTAWLYSNANYLLIGAIIEQVTGQPLAVAAADLLQRRLGLARTAFDDAAAVVPDRATGYTPTGATPPFAVAPSIDPALLGPAGGMRSTATELARWHQALFAGAPLGDEVRAAMITPARVRGGELTSAHRFSPEDAVLGATEYGLGLRLDRATTDGTLIAAHEGAVDGFAAYLATHVETRLTLACLCNVDLYPGVPFRALRRQVFARFLPPPA